MTHLSEEELIAFRECEGRENAAIAEHLQECAQCRAEFTQLDTELTAVFAALDTLAVPDPGREYGQRVWQQIASQLQSKSQPSLQGAHGDEQVKWWRTFFVARRVAAFAGLSALVVMAFLAGRGVKDHRVPDTSNAANLREKVLLLAVGEHLGRSEMMLTELSNTETKKGGAKLIDISAEQKRAEDLLTENRLYRETALEQGDARIANVLDELERVLLDVAHSPKEVTGGQLQGIRERIDAGGILFKLRVVGADVEERQRATPTDSANLHNDRKKV